MPIRYNQNQGSRYQDEDDQLLGMFFGGLAQGASSYERAKDRRLEQDYRNKQYDLAKTSAQNEQDYRQSMLTEAKEGRKFEESYKDRIYNLEKGKTEAAVAASNEALEVSKLQRQEAGLKLGETTRQVELGKAGTEAEALAAEIAGRAASMPYGMDYDYTFSNDQIMLIDPVNGQKYIDHRDKVLSEITSVAARMNQANPNTRPGDAFMLQMQQANERNDARITEALSKNQWNALSTDTMFGTNPFGPSADGKPQQPSQMQQWYATTNAKVQSGAMSYKDAMLAMAQERDKQIDYQAKLQQRSNFQEDLVAEINGLRSVIPNLKGSAKFMAQRQAEQMTGILAELKYTTDDKIAGLAEKFGGIIGGQGQIEFGPELQRFASERLAAVEGSATPEAELARKQVFGMVAQTPGGEVFGEQDGAGQGTPFPQAGAAFTSLMGFGGQVPAGAAVRTGDGAVAPGGGGTPETPPVPKSAAQQRLDRAQKLVDDAKAAFQKEKSASNRFALRNAEKELETVSGRLTKSDKALKEFSDMAKSIGGGIEEYAGISSPEDYQAAVAAIEDEIKSAPTYFQARQQEAQTGTQSSQRAVERRGKLDQLMKSLKKVGEAAGYEE